MYCSTFGFPVHHQIPELTQTHVHHVGDAIQPSILCRPLLLLPSIFPSIRVFSKESLFSAGGQSIGVSASHQSFQWILRTDSFRMGWLDLLAIRGILKSLLQHHSSNTSILQHSVFFIIQLSHTYMTTGKTTALNRQTFVGKVMSLLFNMLSSLVIAFLPRSKHLLISWLQSPSAVITEPPPKIVSHCFHCFPIYFPWSDGTRCHDLSFLNVEFKPTFSFSYFTFIKRLFSVSSLSAIRVMSPAYSRLLIFLPLFRVNKMWSLVLWKLSHVSFLQLGINYRSEQEWGYYIHLFTFPTPINTKK